MSLDVWLEAEIPAPTTPRIYIREEGRTKAITRKEWDERFPDREPMLVHEGDTRDVWHGNITHNLTAMAREAGCYEAIWRPEDVGVDGIETAGQMIKHLARGLNVLIADPQRFKRFNPANGWGDYQGLMEFMAEYLDAAVTWPDAKVRVWR